MTYALMISTDGTRSVFGVFSPCTVRNGGTALDISTANLVARYEHTGPHPTPLDLTRLAEAHATQESPAFCFQQTAWDAGNERMRGLLIGQGARFVFRRL